MEKRKQEEKKKPIGKKIENKNRNMYTKQESKTEKRQKSRCQVSKKCNSCKMIDISYEEQLEIKKKETEKLLKPYVKLGNIIGMEKPEYYQNKVSAAFTHDKRGNPLSGVYKDGYIIPVDNCLVENEKAGEIIQSIKGLLPSFKIKTYDEGSGYGLLRHVMVRIGQRTGQIMVVLVLASPIMPSKNNFVKALLKLHPDITTIIVNANNRKTSMVLGDKEQVLYGKGYIEDILCGQTYKITSKSLYQTNPVQTEQLYKRAIKMADLTGKEEVLNAYGGIGTLGMLAAGSAKNVIYVEKDKEAVKEAVINTKINKISNIQFYQKEAGQFLAQLTEQGKTIDTLFMEPSRGGCDEVFLDALTILKPRKVIYISCYTESLVRDMAYLVKKGYKAEKSTAVDMAPFTRRVEVICQLVLKKGK